MERQRVLGQGLHHLGRKLVEVAVGYAGFTGIGLSVSSTAVGHYALKMESREGVVMRSAEDKTTDSLGRTVIHHVPDGYVNANWASKEYGIPITTSSHILTNNCKHEMIRCKPVRQRARMYYPESVARQAIEDWLVDPTRQRDCMQRARHVVKKKEAAPDPQIQPRFRLPDISAVARSHREKEKIFWG